MAQQNEEHFETIDKNKAKAYEEQKSMRQELIDWVNSCNTMHMQELHAEMTRMKTSHSNSFSFLSSLREVLACALCYNF